jgi:type I restriction enzyme S subunit
MSQIPLVSIPDNWKIERLDRLFQIRNEPARIDDPPVSAFIDGTVTLRSNRPDAIIKGSGQEIGYKHIEIGDLVISGMNAHLGGLGISDSSGKCTPVYTVMKKIIDLDSRFISYYLWHAAKSGYIKSLVNAVRYNSADFGPETIKRFMVPLPPIEEQRRIAEYLDEQLSQIKLLIELKTSQIDKNRQLLSSEFAEMFLRPTKGTIPLKRLLLDERLGIWGEEPGESELDVTVARVADFNRLTFSLNDATTTRSVTRNQFKSRKVCKGDLLLERSGGGEKSPVGCAVYVSKDFDNLVTSNFVSRLRPAPNVSGRYLSFLFAALYMTGQQTPHSSQTTGIQNLDTESYFQTKVPKLDLEQQISLSEKAEEFLSDISFVNSRIESSIDNYRELRNSIIAGAVNGELVNRESLRK